MNITITNLEGESKTLENVSWGDGLLQRIEAEYGLTVDYYDLYDTNEDDDEAAHITNSLKFLRNTEPRTELLLVKSDVPIRITDNNVIRDDWSPVWAIEKMKTMFGPIDKWDVSFVRNMGGVFAGNLRFNEPIGNWDVSSVNDMDNMFSGAESFNQPIGNWDVSSVVYMNEMFMNTISFNQPIGNWDVSNVTQIGEMFMGALSFDQPIEKWDTSNTRDNMFLYGTLNADPFE